MGSRAITNLPTGVRADCAAQAALLVLALLALVRKWNRITGGREHKRLLYSAVIACSVVLTAFAIGTYEGASAFARAQLGWTDWRSIIPWAALDAASFGFGLFWIRAGLRGSNPSRPRRVVYLCAGFSATLQMIQGGDQRRWQAGLFLAFLAAIGALILHTLVDQLRDAEVADEAVWAKTPPFGLRWLTYAPNTLCAFLAWINHPPVGLTPTVGNAVTHLSRVRAGKAAASSRLPLMRRSVATAALSGLREQVDTLSAAHAEQVRALTEQHAAQVETLRAELARIQREQDARAARRQTDRRVQ